MQEGVQNLVHIGFEVGAVMAAYAGGFYAATKGLDMMGGAGRSIGNAFNKAGGSIQGKVGERKSTNAFALRRQLNKEARKEQRLEGAADSINSGRGRATSWMTNPRRALPGRLGGAKARAREQRVRAQAGQYTAEQQKKAFGKINYQHAQALSMANGDADRAAQMLQERGIQATGQDLRETATALQQGGLDLRSASTAQALGDLAADSGTLLAGYGNTYQQIAGRGGAYQQALAAGTAQQWVRTTRGKSNFAADQQSGIARLGSFSNTAATDIDAILARATTQERRYNAGQMNQNEARAHAADMDRLERYFAQAQIARDSGDARMDEHRWAAVERGRQTLGAQRNNLNANIATYRTRIEAEDRSRTQL